MITISKMTILLFLIISFEKGKIIFHKKISNILKLLCCKLVIFAASVFLAGMHTDAYGLKVEGVIFVGCASRP